MADNVRSAKHRAMPPLRLDPDHTIRRSLEISPNRFSIHSSQVHTPSSSVPSTPVISTRPPSPEKRVLHPGESNTFLTALAAQERRVLELKEELQKAERELEKLKKQWATHEATRKRNELQHIEQLQPLKESTGGPITSREDELSIAGKDADRRKMAPPMVRPSRTVFSGSRHARALSLLSPKDSNSYSPSPSHGPPKRHRFSPKDDAQPTSIHQSSISTDGSDDPDELYRGPPKDMILETGKQLVGDFRQGLWTFFEDLRQVTVGDEAASVPSPRKQPSMVVGNLPKTQAKTERLLRVRISPAEKEDGTWQGSQHQQRKDLVLSRQRNDVSAQKDRGGNAGPPSAPADKSGISDMNSISSDSDDEDEWDNWDTMTTKGLTPRSNEATSATDLLSSPVTNKSSPRTSTRSVNAACNQVTRQR